MSQKMYLRILQIGVYLSLFSVLFVFKNLLFPFITSKQLPFNILMEALFVLWLVFIIKYPVYRPKWSYVTFGLGAFFVMMVLSCFTGVDFNLSFWGDIERMLGAFHILHFFILYLIIITVFREWKDWRILMMSSVFVAIIVALKGLGGVKSYSTIGNSAYVSGYLIFNMYFSFLLFFKERKNDYRWLYILPVVLMLMHFNKANTTGALVGLGFSLMVATFLYGILSKNKKIKITTLSLFAVLILSSFLVLSNRDSDFVKNTPFLKNARGINIEKNTFQTRLISWRAGLTDLKNHPLLGTGHGNFAIVFDKHFDPDFYNYTRQETYFDRAHNNLIDIATTTGILGLVTYLSIFIAAGYYIVTGYRAGKQNIHEFVLVSSLIIAYFVQNLAVFDSLATYIGIMITLGYVYWMNTRGELEQEELPKDEGFINKEKSILVLAAIIMLLIAYQYNVKPWRMLIGTIEGQKVANNKEMMIEEYKKALSLDTVLDRDSRTSLIRAFSNPRAYNGINPEKREETKDYIIELAEKNVAYNPGDSMAQMMLAQVLNSVASTYIGTPDKFNYYSGRALEAIDKSIEASPGRVPIYYQKSQILITRDEKDKALETLKYAYDLSPEYWDSACHLGKTLIFLQKEDEGYKYLDECVGSVGGANLLAPAGFVKGLVNRYAEQEDWPKVINLYKRLTKLEPKVATHWINLAKLYAGSGDNENAKKAVEAAVKVNPNIKEYAEEFLGNLDK